MGTDKALLVVEGTALARRVADALAAGGATLIRCIGGDAPALEALGLAVVPDERPGAGPVGAVLTALHEAERHLADVVVVAACDHPDLDGPTVARLLAALAEDAARDFAVAVDGDGQRALVVALRREPVAEAAAHAFAAGQRSMAALYAVIDGVDVTDLDPPALRDVDRPTDLDKR